MGMDEPMAVLPGRGVAAWNVFIARACIIFHGRFHE
jgi:hypothetical protein